MEKNSAPTAQDHTSYLPGLAVRAAEPPVPPGEDVYDTTTEPPGEVLILSYDKFCDDDRRNDGSLSDVKNLTQLFTQMGYGLQAEWNLSRVDTIRTIKAFSANKRLKKAGCVIVIVLSHGRDRRTFYTSDGRPLRVDSVRDFFLEEACPHMKGKPKIFLFQMCRGEDEPTEVVTDSIDAVREPPRNMMAIYSTTEGFVSVRHKDFGSPFVNAFCEILAKEAWHLSLDELLRKIQKRYNTEGFGAVIDKQDFHFMKRFYFNPRRRCVS
ncbi:caspase Dronc-like [Penaeus monodon]|uniref:caspase Dronc-like n=1 Tax=Penaeus monodon TaxID=6687 RepID=UPI0018A7E1B6|nr:caspase Dronc-like [Penaeus monodon]XP_037782365.1 caspase Dronc-like [Penaeus monodon]XP_037782366.1 caspase Dronc-like [Penaeus monodon]